MDWGLSLFRFRRQGMNVIDGTVLMRDSDSDNSCEIVYTIQLK